MPHILIIEDDPKLSSLIMRGLEPYNMEISQAFDGLTGQKLALQKDFDLVITDIILPHINGLDLCKTLRNHKPQLPIIMLTALGTTDDKLEGFDAGADDYMVKPFEIRELVARVQVLLRRNSQALNTSPTLLQYHDLVVNLNSKKASRNEQEIKLTPKEFKLLAYFLQNPERVLSRNEIAENVWDTHFDTGTNYIDVYINYLRNKIDKNFETKLIHTRPGMGFVLQKE